MSSPTQLHPCCGHQGEISICPSAALLEKVIDCDKVYNLTVIRSPFHFLLSRRIRQVTSVTPPEFCAQGISLPWSPFCRHLCVSLY